MKVFPVFYIPLHKTVKAKDSKTTIQQNKLIQLENSMLMYCIYNAETLERQHGIFTTIVSSFIGLAYEGISSFLHNFT